MAISKAQRQEIRELKRRNHRWETRKTVVEGNKCIGELLKSDWNVERIYCTAAWKASHSTWIADQPQREGLIWEEVSAKDLEMMTNFKTAPGVLAVTNFQCARSVEVSSQPWLFLDDVGDPGNVGTLVRVADWFGWGGVIASPQSADPMSPKAIQSAMGSTFHVPIHVGAFDTIAPSVLTCAVGLDAGGDPLFPQPNTLKPTLVVVGSESHGLTEKVAQACHHIVSIPGSGRAESLNASVAGAIAMAMFTLQRAD
jgi:TrmH family RNA methyltransferase